MILVRNPESARLLGDVVRGDLSLPDMLDTCSDGTAPAFLDAVTKHGRRIVYLSSEGVGDDLQQQTDTITARIAAEPVA